MLVIVQIVTFNCQQEEMKHKKDKVESIMHALYSGIPKGYCKLELKQCLSVKYPAYSFTNCSIVLVRNNNL